MSCAPTSVLRHPSAAGWSCVNGQVVIVSSDGINESARPWLLGVGLRGRDPGDLLAVPVPDHGWAYAGDLTRIYRGWIGPAIEQLGATTRDRLDGALRAALDL